MVELLCIKEIINERGPYILAEWSFAKERINDRGRYVLVDWPCVNKKTINEEFNFWANNSAQKNE